MALCERIEIVGPYLNFFYAPSIYEDLLALFQRDNLSFLFPQKAENSKKTIFIDYIGANVGKPLHIGHMCTPNQGQVCINLFKKIGYNVISDSHIGDWGIIFGKLITAYKKYGDIALLEQDAVEHLFQLYVKISAEAEEDTQLDDLFRSEFKLLSEGNPDSVALWAEFTKYSIERMRISLSRIFVKPDYDIGESFYEGL